MKMITYQANKQLFEVAKWHKSDVNQTINGFSKSLTIKQ